MCRNKNRKEEGSLFLGHAIDLFAKENNLSKYRIAKNADLPQTTLNEIANGKNTNPTIDTIEKIARGIGVSVSDFIKKVEELDMNYKNENKQIIR